MRRRSGTRILAAVLFTDIVDSTAVASRLGDARWKELIARHHAIVRRELKRFGGKELDTAGDGFYASFGGPASAIRCACAAAESVRELGIEIRTGVHFGECEQVGGKLGGMAVVVGARVMSLGGPGDVLVTASTSDLVAGAGLEFQDRGTHSLKGVDGRWHVLAVSEVDGAPRSRPAEPEEAEQRIGEVQPSAPRSRTWQVVAAVAAVALLAALVAVPLARRAGGNPEIAPNSIGIMDPSSGEVVSTLGLGARPGSIATSGNDVWVTSPDAGTVTRIDSNDQDIVDSIQVGENPTGIAVGQDVVWVVESGGPSVSRISPDTNSVVGDPIQVGNGPIAVAVGEGAVWVTNTFDGTISRIDPSRGEVTEEISVGLDPHGVAIGFGSVWVALAGSNAVVRIDPLTNEVSPPINVGDAPGAVAVSADAVWVANTLHDTVSRINPVTDSVVDTVEVGGGPSEISVVEGNVWVANEAEGTLSRIEPGEPSVSTTVIGSIPQALAGVGGELWVSVRGQATSHRGGTLKLVSERSVDSLDSTVTFDEASYRLMHLLGDGLVAFEPVGGTNPRLVPDLATSLPTPTEDGRTYRFELRPGIRYSNGEVVVADDFRRAIERVFDLQSYGVSFFTGLEGSEACTGDGRCDLSRGIDADSDSRTITFHLKEADAEFLYKLTLAFAYPIPASSSGEQLGPEGSPGTGPYMVEPPMTDEGLTLVRNPHFQVWSPSAQPDGYVDRIEWTFGLDPQAQVDAVESGQADLAYDVASPAVLQDLYVRFAAQTHSSPIAGTFWIALDTSAPPFDDIDVRRAINLAVDRDRVVELFGGEGAASPTCQQLPPNFPGYEPYCPYTSAPAGGVWSAPSLETARRIIRRSGTAGMDIRFEYPPEFYPVGAQVADYFVELLGELGYHVRVKAVPGEELLSPGYDLKEMTLDGWYADYPAASNFFTPFLASEAYLQLCTFCDRQLRGVIDRATELQPDDPAKAGALWAEVDREMVDRAPFVWLVNQIAIELVSERLGNYQWSPNGALLNQLWVR